MAINSSNRWTQVIRFRHMIQYAARNTLNFRFLMALILATGNGISLPFLIEELYFCVVSEFYVCDFYVWFDVVMVI